MSAVLPEPLALDQPDEDPHALADLLDRLTAAAFRLGTLRAHLAGPAAAAPGWLGEDAAAAATQVGAATILAGDAHAALTGARDRLRRHAELLAQVRSRIAALRTQQEEDYGAAAARLAAAAQHPVLPWAAAQPPVLVVLADELRTAEAARRRQHGALLDELRSDALETARYLAGCTAPLGGTGRPDDAQRVVAHLAAQLPGWGNGELGGRAASLAAALTGPATFEEIEALAEEYAPLAGTSAFADALLGILGPSGVRYLLTTLGLEREEAGAPLAGLLAAALAAARPSGGPVDRVAEVLGASYVRSDDPDGTPDAVVLGMGAVLAAGVRLPGGGPRPATVATWGVQMLERERALSGSAVARVPGHDGEDPVALVLDLLDRAGDPAAAARLLGGSDAWTALLARGWDDGGQVLSRVVALAAGAPGSEGAVAARSGLEALGTGLSSAGAEAWAVHPGTAAAVETSLARLSTAHLQVVTGLLQQPAGRGPMPAEADTALRGLGHLTADPHASSLVEGALRAWARAVPPASAALAGSTLGSFVAVRQYGQRLAYALRAAAVRDAALDRQFSFAVITLPLKAVRGPAGELLDVGQTLLAHLIGADGSWSAGPDRGLVLTRADATATALAGVPAADPAGRAAAASSAGAAFDRTLAALGTPQAPVPESLARIALDEVSDRIPTLEREVLKGWLESGVGRRGR